MVRSKSPQQRVSSQRTREGRRQRSLSRSRSRSRDHPTFRKRSCSRSRSSSYSRRLARADKRSRRASRSNSRERRSRPHTKIKRRSRSSSAGAHRKRSSRSSSSERRSRYNRPVGSDSDDDGTRRKKHSRDATTGKNKKRYKKKDKTHRRSERGGDSVLPATHNSTVLDATDVINNSPLNAHDDKRVRSDAAIVAATTTTATVAAATPLDVRSFFDRVKAQEAGKEAVGTVHASGVRAPNPTAAAGVLEQWECVKRGCGQKNNKRAPACTKCGAMKRLTEWR